MSDLDDLDDGSTEEGDEETKQPGCWARQRAAAQARQTAVKFLPKVVIYKNAKEYQKEAPKMFAKGWTADVDSTDSGCFTVARFVLTRPFALAMKKDRGELTVTWMPPKQ
jgi:hypothetical protein